jgi:hypothetical protein
VATSKVAVIRVTPEGILHEIDRLLDLAGVSQALARDKTTILKDNISWHFPFPGANTTPWQLEGTIRALSRRGFNDQVCVQNKTVVTNAFKGEDLNHYVPIFKRYGIPVLYNFKDEDMTWVRFEPKARMRVLKRIFPEGIHIPDYFLGKNSRPPADDEVPHLHDDDRRDEERVRRAVEHAAALHALRGSTKRSSTCWRSRRRFTRGCSRSWTARPPATDPDRGPCIRWSRT